MSKKQHKGREEFKGLKGWEKNYLLQSERYGHLDAGNGTKKQQDRYSNKRGN